MPGQILVVDDDPIECKSLSEFLRLEGYTVDSAEGGAEAIDKLRNKPFQVVLTDVNMPDVTGFDVLKHAAEHCPDLSVVLITGYGQIEAAVEAIKLGAFDYITKPLIDDGVKLSIERALGQQRLRHENLELKKQLGLRNQYSMLLGRDHKMQKIYDIIDVVANTKATVLVTGESGTGKSLIARTVHQKSARREQPFIEISCGALPETLLESELFGHVKGSFTGAVSNKEGKFLAADGGTIFLDEIDSATPSLQMKLLRVLQERQFEPVGSNETQTVDVRVILATNKNLQQEVKAGRFREDLYYRINVVNIDLPSLAERTTDIPLLAERFLNSMCQKHNKNKTGFADETIPYLLNYHWPGNVRELENVVERAVVLGRNSQIFPDDLPAHVIDYADQQTFSDYKLLSLREALEEPEKKILEKALRHNNWNRQATAEMLQINRTTLYKKLKRFNLDAEQLSRTVKS